MKSQFKNLINYICTLILSTTCTKILCKNKVNFCNLPPGAKHTVYSLGENYFGHLGMGIDNTFSEVPIPIPILPKIKQVSCGNYFTICLDYEGFIWSLVTTMQFNSEQANNTKKKIKISPQFNLFTAVQHIH